MADAGNRICHGNVFGYAAANDWRVGRSAGGDDDGYADISTTENLYQDVARQNVSPESEKWDGCML